jgi:PPOX class probable F420-dependent enzyme
MGVKLPQNAVKLIEEKNFAHLATLLHDGAPHVAPVWVDHDGDIILINTAVGRVKHKNINKDPRVALSITDKNNPYNRIEIRGLVISQTTDGADTHIDKLAAKYTGVKKYQRSSPDEKRIILHIEPLHVSS